jgi:hypothetical protein
LRGMDLASLVFRNRLRSATAVGCRGRSAGGSTGRSGHGEEYERGLRGQIIGEGAAED